MICIVCSKQYTLPGKCPECGWDVDRSLDTHSLWEPGHVLAARFSILEIREPDRFGVTFRARDSRLNSDVLIRCIHPAYLPEDPHRKRFTRAMTPLLQNRYPVVAAIHDIGQYRDLVFVATEYFEGGSLLELMEKRNAVQRSFAVNEVYPIFRQLTAFCMESGTPPHGAIWPGNIFFLPGNLKIADCGLLAALSPAVIAHRFSLSGSCRPYVAPEILKGDLPTPASDVYSLGVILGEMLTRKAYNGHPDMFSCEDPDMPPDLAELLRCALSAEPENRYATAEVFLHALCDVAALPVPTFQNAKQPGRSSAPPSNAQAERTAQVLMSDIIQQHYEEVTSVGRMPEPPAPRPPIRRAPAPHPNAQDSLVSPDAEGTREIDLAELSEVSERMDIDSAESSTARAAVSVLQQAETAAAERSTEKLLHHSSGLDGVDPRFIRAAFKNETEKVAGISSDAIRAVQVQEHELDGIDPRFIRAAARLSDSKMARVQISDIDSSDDLLDDDWRSRISNETEGREDSIVSFLTPPPTRTEDSTVQGFPRRPVGWDETPRRPGSPPPPPRPKR